MLAIQVLLAKRHHDSHEAHLCDLPSPVKKKLVAANNLAYEELGDALDLVIAEALGVTFCQLVSGLRRDQA